MAPTLALDGDGPRARGRRRRRHAPPQRARRRSLAGDPRRGARRRRRPSSGRGSTRRRASSTLEPGFDRGGADALEAARATPSARWPDAAPLLRRRQRRHAGGRGGRSAAERRCGGCLADRRPAEVAALRTARVPRRPCRRRRASSRRSHARQRTAAAPRRAAGACVLSPTTTECRRLPKLALSYLRSYGSSAASRPRSQPRLPQTGQGSAIPSATRKAVLGRRSRGSEPASTRSIGARCSMPDRCRRPANLRR